METIEFIVEIGAWAGLALSIFGIVITELGK